MRHYSGRRRRASGRRCRRDERSLHAGTGALLRLALRRDRIQIPVWLVAQAAVLGGSGSSIVGLYDTPRSGSPTPRTSASSVVTVAFNGPTSGAGDGRDRHRRDARGARWC